MKKTAKIIPLVALILLLSACGRNTATQEANDLPIVESEYTTDEAQQIEDAADSFQLLVDDLVNNITHDGWFLTFDVDNAEARITMWRYMGNGGVVYYYFEYWGGFFVQVRKSEEIFGFSKEVWDLVSPFEYRHYVYRDGEFVLRAWTILPVDQITFQATDEIEITISHNPDSLFPHLTPFIEFEDTLADQRIAFISNVPIANFRYIEINGAVIDFIVEDVLFVIDELAAFQPFVVHWQPRGSSPHRGFAFDDENGVSRYFMFHYDARGHAAFRFSEFDGELTLEELE